jgi:hypothetical protein
MEAVGACVSAKLTVNAKAARAAQDRKERSMDMDTWLGKKRN